jgi:hypothetical protein
VSLGVGVSVGNPAAVLGVHDNGHQVSFGGAAQSSYEAATRLGT